jgi:hypothetical protein
MPAIQFQVRPTSQQYLLAQQDLCCLLPTEMANLRVK